MSPAQPAAGRAARARQLTALSLGALGVVYGDIGTSPLYALRECFHGAHAVEPTPAHVLGVLSLVFWSLVIVISLKYLVFVMRADNRGEGGVLALVALVVPGAAPRRGGPWLLALLGVFGASLLYGDGIITPAISVLSAVEGLEIATPAFRRWVVPATVAILVGVFSIQSRGTGRVGRLFGPVMLLWFATLAVLGLRGIAEQPSVLAALAPWHALSFLAEKGGHGFLVLASVFLVVTGGEALYADMGHFGRRPIRMAWFVLVLPALLLNYFGQGALLLGDASAAANPFYRLAPAWSLVPLVLLATAATVIASQALISGAFSLTHQAIQLGYSPRLAVKHTSARESGQIYVASMNWALMLAACALVIGFGSSTNLAAAYGLAVTGTMLITTLLLCVVARRRWRWGVGALVLGTAFLPIDVAFFGANLLKIADGGWFAIVVAALGFALMSTWKRGRALLRERLEETSLPLELFLPDLETSKLARVPRSAVFLAADAAGTPLALLHNIKHNQVVHATNVLLTIQTAAQPSVPDAERLDVHALGQGFFRVVAHYGFMEAPDVPALMRRAHQQGLELDPDRTSYYLGHERLISSGQSGMARWREILFSWMSRNAQGASSFFGIPPGQVVELGAQVVL